jgi:hypothetical protein
MVSVTSSWTAPAASLDAHVWAWLRRKRSCTRRKELALEGVKYRANAFRITMSIADEADVFQPAVRQRMREATSTRVAALVNKSVAYVSDRINLLTGDEEVFEALRAKKISIGVAQLLNRVDTRQLPPLLPRARRRARASRATTMERWLADYKADRPRHVSSS